MRPIVDQSMIINALKRCQGVIAGPNGAANMLGLKRTTLLSRMQKWALVVKIIVNHIRVFEPRNYREYL